MEFIVLPKYVEEILIDCSTKKVENMVKKAGMTIDDHKECSLIMEFYDGVAYEVTGTGLMLRYPTLKEIAKSKAKQDSICDYIGIYDGTISQHDVALRYGKLELSDKEEDKVIHCTKHEQELRDETLILLSADIYQQVYDSSDDNMDYNRAARIVRELGDQFEKELDWQGSENEDRDYILELETFEERELKKLEVGIYKDPRFQ